MNRLPLVIHLFAIAAGFSPLAHAAEPDLKLWYDEPANEWIEAMPIGNGRFGAMVFGQPVNERFQLNDVTVWSGSPQPDADRKDAWKNLPELRRLIRALLRPAAREHPAYAACSPSGAQGRGDIAG